MAIKARETITIIKERDVNATWRFYRIASSSSSPSQPTEAQGKAYVNNQTVPSGWSISEPAYDGTSTNSLYTCDLTSFTDGEVSWSTVSKSSSYEAAKQAYNEAQNAKRVATNFMSADSTGIMVADMRSGSQQTPSNPSGRNVLIDNDSVDIRNGTDVLASFGSTAVIGQEGKSRATIDYHSLQMLDATGAPYFVVEDLRDETGNALIYQKFECTYEMYDDDEDIDPLVTPVIEVVDMLNEQGESVLNVHAEYLVVEINDSGTKINISMGRNHRDEIWTIIFRTTGEAKFYTLGQRSEGSNRAPFSIAAGYDVEASGYAAFAEGYGTISAGKGTHAEGINTEVNDYSEGGHAEGIGTRVLGKAGHAEGRNCVSVGGHAEGVGVYSTHPRQTAMGSYNKEIYEWHSTLDLTPEYLLVVGNGLSDSERSNAFVVTWTGSVIGQAMAGMIQMFAGSTPPKGWLKCNGAAVSRTDYAVLFSVIGTTYGAGDGSTTFNLPNFTDRFPVGAGDTYALNSKGGANTVTLNTNQIPAHTHGKSGAISGGITGGSHSHSMKNIWSDGSGSSSAYVMSSNRKLQTRSTEAQTHTHNLPAHEHTSVGGGQAHENRPPYIGINFIICTGRTDEERI